MSKPAKASFSREDESVARSVCLKILEVMLLTRFLDDKLSKLVRQNKGGTFHLAMAGHELIGAVSALSLQSGKDWGLPYYRDRAFVVGIGSSLVDLIGSFLARNVAHHSGGRMMPEHYSDKSLRIPCQSSCVGSQFLQAVGVAKAIQLEGKDELVYVSAGDGATSQGDFHEALNFASLHRLGVLFVIQDNDWAISVPLKEQTAGGSIAEKFKGYTGLAVFEVDGCDYEEVSIALSQAVQKGRSMQGPSLIVAKVPRLGPHSSSDDPLKYKTQEIVADEKMRDPLPRFESWLLGMGLIVEKELVELKEALFRRVEVAAAEADAIPFPNVKTAQSLVFKPIEDSSFLQVSKEKEDVSSASDAVVMMDALNHALEEEMRRDPKVVVFGQDVAHGKGGVFGITRTLTAKFGERRCFNTPLAESTIVGLSVGLSLAHGYKPVAEIQFADYAWTGINQLFNELASLHYRSNGEWHCPVVIRMPYGGYIQGGPYHSQSIEAFLCHCPGLKVVIPSNASDAKRLLKTAIRDPNPVIFLEHKALYRQRVFCARREPESDDLLPFGQAKVVRAGRDVTFVGWGMMIVMAMEVSEKLFKEGIDVEVVDLRTLVPLDIDTVLLSLKKTGKLLIAHEAAKNAGFGAEIAAQVVEKAFHLLDAPIVRVASSDCPVPYCKELEDAVLPQARDIETALRQLARF
ncbi:MAG: thiamine pyrophosphate-dependent enzyme [Anaerolineae bacterium]